MGLGSRLGLVPVVLGLALGFAMVRPSSAAAPLNDISGEYAGKVKYKNQVIDPEEETGGTGTLEVGFSLGQDGTSITGAFLIKAQGEEDEDELLLGSGRAGNGRFWFRGDTETETITIAGSMKGSEGKRVIKAKGIHTTSGNYSDIKVSLKEGDSGIEK